MSPSMPTRPVGAELPIVAERRAGGDAGVVDVDGAGRDAGGHLRLAERRAVVAADVEPGPVPRPVPARALTGILRGRSAACATAAVSTSAAPVQSIFFMEIIGRPQRQNELPQYYTTRRGRSHPRGISRGARRANSFGVWFSCDTQTVWSFKFRNQRRLFPKDAQWALANTSLPAVVFRRLIPLSARRRRELHQHCESGTSEFRLSCRRRPSPGM